MLAVAFAAVSMVACGGNTEKKANEGEAADATKVEAVDKACCGECTEECCGACEEKTECCGECAEAPVEAAAEAEVVAE